MIEPTDAELQLKDVSEDELYLYETITMLAERFTPHEGQVIIGNMLIYQHVKKVFASAGRNFGKSRLAAFLLVWFARMLPGTAQYYFAPFQKQAKEIMWQSRVLLNMIPPEWVESVNSTESRITLTNASSIKVDGSDNYEAYRGVKTPGLTVADEIKDFRPEFLEAYMPNAAAFDSPMLLIGTPDSKDGVFSYYMELAKKSPTWRYYQAPTWVNPHISQKWLDEKKAEMIMMGEEEQWQREFEAVYVKGGKRSIYPMAIGKPHPKFDDIKPKDLNKWVIMVATDPAATSVFGVVFILHNPFTLKSIIFNELYLDIPSEMTSRNVFFLVEEKLAPFKGIVKSIRFVNDPAAAYFENEINSMKEARHWWFEGIDKNELGIQGYIDLNRILFLKEFVTICEECPKLIWEIESYEKDEKGRIPDKNDHNINAMSYGFHALGLSLEAIQEKTKPQKEERRGYSIHEEFAEKNSYREID